MNWNQHLELGEKYSKTDLAQVLDEPSLNTVREGIFNSQKTKNSIFFVDLVKQGKEERFHFDDFFQGEYFHWDSQPKQHINTPTIQSYVTGERTPHLFARVHQKIKSKTQPFVYCGRLSFLEHEENTANPVHVIFKSEDFDDFTENEDLLRIYHWRPDKAGKTTKSRINKEGEISENRKRSFKRPTRTERKGLITSRVGQGFYRQEVIRKWQGMCPLTSCKNQSILIASHIVPWKESTEEERLDPDNSILLSPVYDALFDRHLISFSDDGQILISDSLDPVDIENLSLGRDCRLPVNEGMKKYLSRHREKLLAKSSINRNYEIIF